MMISTVPLVLVILVLADVPCRGPVGVCPVVFVTIEWYGRTSYAVVPFPTVPWTMFHPGPAVSKSLIRSVPVSHLVPDVPGIPFAIVPFSDSIHS